MSNSVAACFINDINTDAQQFIQLVGSISVFCFVPWSRYEKIWIILLVNAIFGFIGVMLRTQSKCIESTYPATARIMQSINEFNWFILESSTAYYLYIKTSVVLTQPKLKMGIEIALSVLLALFFGTRISVAVNQMNHLNVELTNRAPMTGLHLCYLVTGCTGILIFILLIANVWFLRKQSSDAQTATTLQLIMDSSLPRLALIVVNNLMILFSIILYQPDTYNSDIIFPILMLLKTSYTLILFIDVMVTKIQFMKMAIDTITGVPTSLPRSINSFKRKSDYNPLRHETDPDTIIHMEERTSRVRTPSNASQQYHGTTAPLRLVSADSVPPRKHSRTFGFVEALEERSRRENGSP